MLTNKSKLTDQVGVPHEPGEWMKFRALSWRDLQAAEEAQMARALREVAGLSPQAFEFLQNQAVQQQASAGQFDQTVMLRSGIAEWSYGEPVSPEALDRLDRRTAEWAYGEIVRRNVIERAEGEG
ncbi:MAG: hypothetical protein OXG46_05990 [Chloroflexi bacterium]|nr:hypothetical protein [Chloroflexota bacterium]MCY3937893.1 hypothetical protein [Chloroflexota bacterium]